MPIIKSSDSGESITVVVFTKREIDALATVLANSSIDLTPDNTRALEILQDLYFALNVPNPLD